VLVMHKLALAYLRCGRWRDAQRMRDRAFALRPDHPAIRALPRHMLVAALRRLLARAGRRLRSLMV